MQSIDALTLSDDAPKENPWQDDRLGYRPFAERLSKIIISLRAPNGYVIGLQGEWGSGKSTAINFVKAFIDKHNVEAEDKAHHLEVLDFRPWMVSGHENLVAAFFKVLSEKLPGAKRPTWVDRNLRRARRVTDPLLDAVATVGVVVDHTGGAASKAAAKVTGAALNTLIDRFLDEPSLQAAHENLRGILAREQKRFLVVLDDIDRLRKDEIRSIMQMVKTVGRLPNVVYLLAYDREIVWPALDESTSVKSSGPNFAEKIVQQEVALPRPATEDLLGILDSEIAFLLGASTSEGRWYNLVADGIRRWIRHPRDVQRLANAVKFSWPALEGEIDPQDLLIMEGLRLFDNLVFEWIRWNKDWLFDEGSYLMAREETKKAWLNSLTDQIPERERERVIRLLAVLFPGQHEVFGKDFREEANWSLVARRGIGSGAGFDAYFSLFPSPNEVPKTVIDMAIAKLNERSFLVDLIDSYVQKTDRNNLSMVPKLLRELAFRFMGRNAVVVPTQDLFEALFEKADDIFSIDWRADPLQLSPNAALIDLSDQMLELWGPDAAAQHLESAFSKSCSLVLSADIFVDQARDFGILPDRSGRRPRIAQDALEALGKILLPQLQQAARDSTLVSAPNFFGIIPAWKYLGGAAAVKKWIEANIQSNPEFLSKLTKGFVS